MPVLFCFLCIFWGMPAAAGARSRPATQQPPSDAAQAGHPVTGQRRTAGSTVLGIQGSAFTINKRAVFLLGASYYGALGGSERIWKQDLDHLQPLGVNWIRVWATWDAAGQDISAVDDDGYPRQPYLGRLKTLVTLCDRRGIVVDVTLSRGKDPGGRPRLASLEAHGHAVETLIRALKPWRNWYLDLANEHNIRDARFVPVGELAQLRRLARRLAPALLVTASHAGDLSRADLPVYLDQVGLDFVCPHRPREAGAAQETETKTREILAWMADVGKTVPIHYQEPFRRGYGTWQPTIEDYHTDLQGARAGGAAGWCFHNGDNRQAKDGRPRRSFDLSQGALWDQLDNVERAFLEEVPTLRKPADPEPDP